MKKEIVLKNFGPNDEIFLKDLESNFVSFCIQNSKIICIDNIKVGVVSLLEENDDYEIKIAITNSYQNKGIASYVIEMIYNSILQRNKNAKLKMLIDEQNLPSISLANKMGFVLNGRNDLNELVFILEEQNMSLKQNN